ncbi:hypothetical protein HOO14_00350 [bacterium]|nr:hypothetical protein [bacterium]
MSDFTENKRYISVSGYGWTGSGACIDLLKEFEGFDALQGEFRIAKDPCGLIDLENSLVHNWDFIRHDVAIRDFLKYCNVLSRPTSLYRKSGKDFSNKLNVDFMMESRTYIDRLTNINYIGDTFVHRYNVPAYKNLFMKLRSKFGLSNAKNMYFSRPAYSDFIQETREYIDNLFNQYARNNTIDTVILDQAIPPTNILNTSKYFKDIKTIIIDRDPRDIYTNMIKRDKLLGPELKNKNSVSAYIEWHKQLRRVAVSDSNSLHVDEYVLRLNFEDLVLNYNDSILKIKDFLGGNMQHNQKNRYFNPSYSVKNIGLWKKYKDQSVTRKINKELEEYCYYD